MPARRRGQEAARAARRAQRDQERVRAHRNPGEPSRPTQDEVDEAWAEHQAWEYARRIEPVVRVVRPRRVSTIDILAVVASVEADFARWRRGDFS